jgi:hypothetical protein
VTRLGEFSPFGSYFSLSCFFPMVRVQHSFDQTTVGPHFGSFFHKLIWSVCSRGTVDTQAISSSGNGAIQILTKCVFP